MAAWEPDIHFEGVAVGAAMRGERELSPVLRRDALNAAGLRPSGEPAAFAVAPVRAGRGGEPAGRRGVAYVETPFEGEGRFPRGPRPTDRCSARRPAGWCRRSSTPWSIRCSAGSPMPWSGSGKAVDGPTASASTCRATIGR